MQRSLVLLMLWPIAAFATPAAADDWQDCQGENTEIRIKACSSVILTGGLSATKASSVFNQRGRSFHAKGDYDHALEDYDEAIRLNPKSVAAFNNRGLTYDAKQNSDRAFADYSEALKLNPKYFHAYNNRGLILHARREYDQAISDFTAALHNNPQYKFAYNNRGLSFHAKGQYDQAISDYDDALRIDPAYANTYSNRGRARIAKRQYDRAFADLNEALRLEPNHVNALQNRARAYRATGDVGRAIADYQRILELPAPLPLDRQRQETAREQIAQMRMPPRPAEAALPRRVALVIGNAAYQHAGVLSNPRNDAREVAGVFRRLGFDEVIEHHDLNREGMVQALKTFGDRAAQSEWAVVFFAGHGMEMNGTNYLVPTDAELKRDTHANDELMSLDRVQAKVDAASKIGLVILDACRNNPFAARMVRSAGATRAIRPGLASVEPDGNVLVAYAAKHGNVAEDGAGKNSPFTEAILAHIEEPGLEINFLFRRVRDAVRAKTERRQEPFVYGSLGSEPLFFKTAAR